MGIEQRVSKAPSADELANEMAKVLEETRYNIIEAQSQMKTQADKHCTEAPVTFGLDKDECKPCRVKGSFCSDMTDGR